jgi:hypothetical protein
MTPDDIWLLVHEEIICNTSDPDVVRSQIQAMLAGLPTDDETMGSVLNEARGFARARHEEFKILDFDIERVVGVMDATMEPMIAWLEANGLTNARHHVFGRGKNWWRDPALV